MTANTTSSLVLSGCGWLTPWGTGGIEDVLRGLADFVAGSAAGASGFVPVPDDPPSEQISHLSKELTRDKGCWMAALAIEHACRTAGLAMEALDSDRVGLTLGCGLAGQLGMIEFASEVRKQSVRFVSPIHFPQTVGNYVAGALARAYKLRGPNATFASGPASSLDAIIEACGMVARGDADVVIAGGVEHLTADQAAALKSNGAAVGEGACFFVVETAEHASTRSASLLANVVGWDHMATCRDQEGIVSCAGSRCAGAILIEHAAGLCLGAAGAAATAAAIGAASGGVVPVVQPNSERAVACAVIESADLQGADGHIPAVVLAQRDPDAGDNLVRLDLAIPANA